MAKSIVATRIDNARFVTVRVPRKLHSDIRRLLAKNNPYNLSVTQWVQASLAAMLDVDTRAMAVQQ
jgi:hypothetical protein